MTKSIIIPSNLNIEKYLDYADAFLFGIKNLSVNMPIYYEIDELVDAIKKIKENNKQIFISLNKNFHNKDLDLVKNILIKLEELKIDGIFYYDVGIVNMINNMNLNIPLVWSSEHLTTNYSTINFWKKYGIKYVNISSEITLDEILEIRKKTDISMIVPIFGYLPIYTSERHVIDNYKKYFNLDNNSKKYYLEKDNNYYPIVDNTDGSSIYSAHILNGYNESTTLKENNIDYLLFNSFNIDEDIFLEILKLYNLSIDEKEIDNLLNDNTDKGFLYKETIYKVK